MRVTKIVSTHVQSNIFRRTVKQREFVLLSTLFYFTFPCISGPASSVCIVTGYGLDGPEIESRWERYFPHLSRPAVGPLSLLYDG
jgi:hypothetical protein